MYALQIRCLNFIHSVKATDEGQASDLDNYFYHVSVLISVVTTSQYVQCNEYWLCTHQPLENTVTESVWETLQPLTKSKLMSRLIFNVQQSHLV